MSEVTTWAATVAGNAVAFDDIDNRDGVARVQMKQNFKAIMAAMRRFSDAQGVNVVAFGAIGDRTPSNAGTDNTAAFTAAIAAALAQGKPLIIPAGNYRIASPLPSITLPATAALRGDGTTLGIIGAGSGSTVITYQGAGELFDIRVQDNFTPFVIDGLRLQRPQATFSFAAIPAGAAIKLSGLYGFQVRDIAVTYFHTAIEVAGSLVGTFSDIFIGWCLRAMRAYPSAGISPNQLSLRGFISASCRDYGIWMTEGTGLTLDGTVIEITGDAANSVKGVPLYLENCGKDGGVAIKCTGPNYFEANYSDYAAYITHSYECNYSLTNALFNRANVADTVISDILFNANALSASVSPSTLDVRGTSFNGINGYVRTSLKPRIAVLAAAGYDQLSVYIDGATGLNRVDAPVFANTVRVIGPAKRVAARARFDGSVPTISENDNIAAIGRNSVGDYNVSFLRPVSRRYSLQWTPTGSDAALKVVNETFVGDTLTVVNIVTHIGGVATDAVGVLTVTGDTL